MAFGPIYEMSRLSNYTQGLGLVQAAVTKLWPPKNLCYRTVTWVDKNQTGGRDRMLAVKSENQLP